MHATFYVAAIVAVIATLLTITRLNPVHALLYLVTSLLAIAVVFYTLGAPVIAALEVIIYAGAIMVLFIFVVMLLNLGVRTTEIERAWLTPGIWIGPSILAAVLLAEIVWALFARGPAQVTAAQVTPKAVGIALYGPYLIGVELASYLLLAGLVGAYHVGRSQVREERVSHAVATDERGAGAGGRAVGVGGDRTAGAP